MAFGNPCAGRFAGAAKLSREIFSGGCPARVSGRPRRRGNPNSAKPLAPALHRRSEVVPRTMVLFTRRARGRIVRGSGERGATWTGDRRARAVGAGRPHPQGFGKALYFQRLEPSRRGSGRDFRGVSGPFRPVPVRHGPAWSGIVRPSPEWSVRVRGRARRLPSAPPPPAGRKVSGAGSTDSRTPPPWRPLPGQSHLRLRLHSSLLEGGRPGGGLTQGLGGPDGDLPDPDRP